MKENTMKFYRCEICGNIVSMVEDAGVTPHCCGQEMTELVAHEPTHEGLEKHVPVIKVDGDKVRVEVGSTFHPMTEEHHIAWIYLLTDKGRTMKYLPHDGEPVAEFTLNDEKLIAAYEYCNLHGLWKKTFE